MDSRGNLVVNQAPSDFFFYPSRQRVSDLLFFSGRSFGKIFTGHDYNWPEHDRYFRQSQNLFLRKRVVTPEEWDRAKSEEPIRLAIIDFCLRMFGGGLFNYLGSNLADPCEIDALEVQIYYPQGYQKSTQEKIYGEMEKKGFFLFREHTLGTGKGWVKILRYNKNLIFLKAENGEFDFVVRNEKDTGTIMGEENNRHFIKNAAGVISFEGGWEDHRKDWGRELTPDRELLPLNATRDIWLEKLKHKSEIHYYRNGGRAGSWHPGGFGVLKTYMTEKNLYRR